MEGIVILEKLCTELGILNPNEYVQRAIEALEAEGAAGSDALAKLIAELTQCRSAKLQWVLTVAERVEPTPALIDAVLEIKTAMELAPVPRHSRFTPEIAGGGKIGWTSGTADSMRRRAVQVLDKLTGAVIDSGTMARPGAFLAGADLAEAELGEADLTGADLSEANLERAVLRFAKLNEANLEGANLAGANLYFADLTGANLRRADLRDANLYMATLTEADLEGADVTGANVVGGVTLPNGKRGGRLADLIEFTRGQH